MKVMFSIKVIMVLEEEAEKYAQAFMQQTTSFNV